MFLLRSAMGISSPEGKHEAGALSRLIGGFAAKLTRRRSRDDQIDLETVECVEDTLGRLRVERAERVLGDDGVRIGH
jgi:hypothetical protein